MGAHGDLSSLPADHFYRVWQLDRNGDDQLNQIDVDLFLASIDWTPGDYNVDGVVDNLDLDLYTNDDYLLYRHMWDQFQQFYDGGRGPCAGNGLQDVLANHVNNFNGKWDLDFNGDGRVREVFRVNGGFETIVNKDSRADDIGAICYAIAAESDPGANRLTQRMDLNRDGNIDKNDLLLAQRLHDFRLGDIDTDGYHFDILAPDIDSIDGRVNEDDLNYFTLWDSLFSQRRRSGEPIGFHGGDLNCDGKATVEDIAIAFSNAGSFLMEPSFSEESNSSNDVDLADFDGDGDLDAFVTVDGARSDQLWVNDRGNFTLATQNFGQHSSIYADTGDFDGDGDVDIFVATRSGNLVWLNDGSAMFVSAGEILGDALYIDVAVGDVDGDGDLDALSTRVDHPGIDVWLNTGVGIFEFAQAFGGSRSKSIELGDLDLDGDLDAIVGNDSGQANRIWFNDGVGTFYDSGQLVGSANTQHVSLGDLDNDGDLDAFLANSGPASDEIWLNDGAGVFMLYSQLNEEEDGSHVQLVDIDDDGDLDAFVANWSSTSNRLWLNNGSADFVMSEQRFGDITSSHVAFGDLDGDGDLDLFVANFQAVDQVFENMG